MSHTRRAPLSAWLLVLAGFLAAGCGGSGDSAGRGTGTSVAEPAVRVAIDNPKAGSVIPATRRTDARVAVSLTVSGRAASAQTIDVRARCPEPECSRVVFSDAAGRWTARLELLLPEGSRGLTVAAGYPTAAAGRGARVDLRVRASPAKRAGRAQQTARARRPATPSSTTSAPSRDTPAPSAPTTQPPSTVPPADPETSIQPGPGATRNRMLLIGDSLAVGIKPVLPSLLPTWEVVIDGRVGRALAEGMSILEGTELPSDGSTVLAISLFTNDDPTHTAQLEAAVRTTLDRAGSRGCVVWATIARPPLNGVSYDAVNALLRRMSAAYGRLRLVRWEEQVAAEPSLLGADGVHPTPLGYQVRGRLYARAAETC